MPDAQVKFLMLIRVSEAVKANADLVRWIDEIEQDYMGRFGDLGVSIAHLALESTWDFALVFPGSDESASYLREQISRKAPGDTDFLIMRGTDLDDFRAAGAYEMS